MGTIKKIKKRLKLIPVNKIPLKSKQMVKQTPKTENISKKLRQLKKIQASMQSDDADVTSQDITIGSSRKGSKIIAKTGKKTSNDTMSVATTDSANLKLKAIGS